MSAEYALRALPIAAAPKRPRPPALAGRSCPLQAKHYCPCGRRPENRDCSRSDGCRSWLLPTVGLVCDDERALGRSHHPCAHVAIAARQPHPVR
jgi:hypothetical protein